MTTRQAAYDALPGALGHEPDDEDYALADALHDAIIAIATSEHVHTGQWCRPCVLHGSDVTLEGMAEAQRVKAEL